MARGDDARHIWNMLISTPLPDFPSRLSSFSAWQMWPSNEWDSVCRNFFSEASPLEHNLSSEEREKAAAAGLDELVRDHEEIHNREHCKVYEAYVVAETTSWVRRMYALVAHLDVMPRSALLHYTSGCHKLDTVIPPLRRLIAGAAPVWFPLGAEILVNHLLLHGTIQRNKEFRRGQRWESVRAVERIRKTLREVGSEWGMVDEFVGVLDKKIKSFAQAPQQEQLRETLELLLGCSAGFQSIKGQVMDSFIEGMLLAREHQLDRERDANVELEERQLFAMRKTAVLEARVISWVVTGKKIATRWCNAQASGSEEFAAHLARSVAKKLAVEPELWQLAKRAFLCIPELASAFWDLLPAHPAHYRHAAANRPSWAPRRRANAAPEHADPFELVRLNPGETVPETSSCLAAGAPFGLAAATSAERLEWGGEETDGKGGGVSRSASADGSSDEESDDEAAYVSKRNVGKWLIEGSLESSWNLDSDEFADDEESEEYSDWGPDAFDDDRDYNVCDPDDKGHQALSGLVRAERPDSEIQVPDWGAGEAGGASEFERPTARIGEDEIGRSRRANGQFPVADPNAKGKPETVINMSPDGQLRVVQTVPEYVQGGVPLLETSAPQDESVCSGGLFEGPVWSEHFPQVGYDGADYQGGFEHQFLMEGGGDETDELKGEGEWPSDWDSEGEPSFGWEIDGVRAKLPNVEKENCPVTGHEIHRMTFGENEDSFCGEGEYESGGGSDEEPSLNWRVRGESVGDEDSLQRPDWEADWASDDSESDDNSGSVSGGVGPEPDVDFGVGGVEIEEDSGGVQEAPVPEKKGKKKRSDAGKPREKRAEKRRRLMDELEGFDDPDLDPAEIEALKAAYVDEALAAEVAARKAAPRGRIAAPKVPPQKKAPAQEIVPGWGGIQNDLLIEILRRSSPEVTIMTSAVCKSWKPVALSDEVWSQHYVAEFGELPRAKPLNKGGQSSCSWHKAFWQRKRAPWNAHICPECGRPCAKNADLLRHMKLAHTGGLQCQLCSETTRFRSEKGLKWHINEKHPEGGAKPGAQELKCEHCHARCKTQQTLDEHVKSMHTERDQLEYVCSTPQCKFRSNTLYKLRRHCNCMEHPLPPPHLACPRPGCTFRGYTRSDVRQHAYSHASQCAECGFQYPPGYNRWGPHPEMPEIGICDGCRARAYRSALTDRPRVRLAHPDE